MLSDVVIETATAVRMYWRKPNENKFNASNTKYLCWQDSICKSYSNLLAGLGSDREVDKRVERKRKGVPPGASIPIYRWRQMRQGHFGGF